MDDSRPTKKRKRVMNQLRDGIIAPPKRINNITTTGTNIGFTCQSYSDKFKNYTVNLSNDNGNLKFTCTCVGGCGTEVTKACRHINTVLLKICSDYINSVEMFEKNKMDYENVKEDLKSVLDDLNKFKIEEGLDNVSDPSY